LGTPLVTITGMIHKKRIYLRMQIFKEGI
jgi:hypothetical protein